MAKKEESKNVMTETNAYLANDNSGALDILRDLMLSPLGYQYIYLLNGMDIRGTQLINLYDNSCESNMDKFKRTILLLANKSIPSDAIKQNFDFVYAISFIDDEVQIKGGVPPYGEEFRLGCPMWDDWCNMQAESFGRRLADYSATQAK